jgi:hypothetical protein
MATVAEVKSATIPIQSLWLGITLIALLGFVGGYTQSPQAGAKALSGSAQAVAQATSQVETPKK